jgi:hypothetical protein
LSPPVGPERRAFLVAFDRRVGHALAARGFRGDHGHYTRVDGDVIAVVEVQLSVYGERVTANVGLHPRGLRAEARLRIDDEGPLHVQECARWTRVGLLEANARDHWWSYETPDPALEGLEAAVLGPGLAWLDAQGEPDALLADARARALRSRGPRHPDGRFAELRVLALLEARAGHVDLAWGAFTRAEQLWPEEESRLAALGDEDAVSVPDLLSELRALVRGAIERGATPPRMSSLDPLATLVGPTRASASGPRGTVERLGQAPEAARTWPSPPPEFVERLETLDTIGFAAPNVREGATAVHRAAPTRPSIPAELTVRGSLSDAGVRAGPPRPAPAPSATSRQAEAVDASDESEFGLDTLQTIARPSASLEDAPAERAEATRPSRAASRRGAEPQSSSPSSRSTSTSPSARTTAEGARTSSPRPAPPRGGPRRPTVAPRVPPGRASVPPTGAPPPRRTPPRRKPS